MGGLCGRFGGAGPPVGGEGCQFGEGAPIPVTGARCAGSGTVRAVRDWLVVADDRTGAFEVAGLLASVRGPVWVTVGAAPTGNGVVDLGSRALSPAESAVRASAVEQQPSRWTAHKIDSTLRGNWAGEVLARQAASGRRLVLLPGWPEMGRTCLDGVVRVNGEPVGRPADSLPGADALAGVATLREWLAGDQRIAVCDVPDSETMHALAKALACADVLIAGPGGPLGAAFAAAFSATPPSPSPPPLLTGSIAVVCGSANAVSHEQLRRLASTRPDVAVVAVPASDGELRPEVATALAERAARWIADYRPETIIVIGGDTAAALLGVAPRSVGGLVAPGMPWSRDEAGGGPLVVTKAGGFGGPDALVELLRCETV